MIQPVTLVLFVVGIVSANAFTTAQLTFQNQSLAYHNQVRATHCAPPLVLDNGLCQIAQSYAEKLASQNLFQHSGTDYGENLYSMTSSGAIKNLPGNTPGQAWYGEISSYDFNNPGFSSDTGHFTQLVWKGTQKVGCGFALGSGNKSAVVVCNYDPAGNVLEEFEKHVQKPTC